LRRTWEKMKKGVSPKNTKKEREGGGGRGGKGERRE